MACHNRPQIKYIYAFEYFFYDGNKQERYLKNGFIEMKMVCVYETINHYEIIQE